MILKEYLKLLASREAKVVLGKNFANLWLLTIVLFATFLSIAFSNGSMKYLSDKMNDPFTNWVDIQKGYGNGDFDGLRSAVEDVELQERFFFDEVQNDNYFALTMLAANGGYHYLEVRFFESFNSKLMQAILNKENVVGNCCVANENLINETYGLVVTEDVLKKLGYSIETAPAYLHYLSRSVDADTLGIRLYENEFAAAPLPLLGVVKRLPGNMDMIASKFLYEQWSNDNTFPLDLNNEDYRRNIIYFVEDGVTDFEEKVITLIPDSLNNFLFQILEDNQMELKGWKPGKMMSVFLGDHNTKTQAFIDLDDKIQEYYKGSITRIYKYNSSEYVLPQASYLSLNFHTLDSIRSFEKFVKEQYNVQIEMAQVNAKENFNAVSIMANILSWAMIVFSIVCIIMFIVNMLQSYFQKVKRNLGTFKAFGMDSNELLYTYILILFVIVFMAILMAVSCTWIIELILPVMSIMKDGSYNYLSLWNPKTIYSMIIVLFATILTVYVVMGRLLKQTPGDLIYDRN